MSRPKDETGATIAKYKRNYAGVIDDTENGDLLAVAEIARAAVANWKPGTGTKYPNNEEGLQLFRAAVASYIDHVITVNSSADMPHKLQLDIEGLCAYTGISRYTLKQYMARGGDWTEFINLVKQGILAYKVQAAQSFRIPPVLSIFDLTNNYGYVNSAEFKLNNADQDESEKERQQLETELVKQLANGEGAAGDSVPLPDIDF